MLEVAPKAVLVDSTPATLYAPEELDPEGVFARLFAEPVPLTERTRSRVAALLSGRAER